MITISFVFVYKVDMYHQKNICYGSSIQKQKSYLGVLSTCRAGARVVGVCAHIAAIIWYLSGARDRDRTAFGVPDWSTYLSNVNNLPEAIDTSDSETESIGSVIEE